MRLSFIVLSIALSTALGCGRGASSRSTEPPGHAGAADGGTPDAGEPDAGSPHDVSIVDLDAGPTPFISLVRLGGVALGQATDLGFTIDPKPGTASPPVSVVWSIGALRSRGYVGEAGVTLPVFGLYAGYDNTGAIQVTFQDGSTQRLPLAISTARYTDPTGLYDHPVVLRARPPGTPSGVSFFAMKSTIAPVVIVDSDAAIRWVGTNTPSMSVLYDGSGFVVGDPQHPTFQRMELDGTLVSGTVKDPAATDFHHNIDPGKQGFLVELDTTSGGGYFLAEIGPDGTELQTWDLAQILREYMTAHGDDPSQLVRLDADWFHMNAATYDPSDDSVIVSSREQFLIKLGYASHDVRWILGDPTKFWATFPSLRARALQVPDGGLYPIGQHATSFTSSGLLMLFDDGFASQHVPQGAPPGEDRSFSVVSAYAIDPTAMTATPVWQYANGLYSRVCSSAYEGTDGAVLVDYAVSDGGVTTRIIALDASHQPVFDLSYPNEHGCDTAWNSVPVPLDHLRLE